MVNDILDVAKIEAGKVQLSFQCVELQPILEELQSMLKPSADPKAVQLHLQTQSRFAWADPSRLRQILLNLLSNAIKFNKHGGQVTLHLYQSGNWLVGQVADTGIGIPKDKLVNLFQEFYQVDNSEERRYEGTGLGLALTKQLVQLHGGDIRVESELGVGSTFEFRLPIIPECEWQTG
jgi:two-component system sensor histidine kinase/response regulator